MSKQQEALNKAMEELEEVEKSMQQEEESELDALTKALEAEIGEPMSKSEDEADEDLSKSEQEPDGDEDGKDDDDDGDGKDEMGKSDDFEFDDELVKASEAYDELTKSVHDGIGSVLGEMDSIKKSMAALMNLNIKQAKVIAELVKSRKDDVNAMAEMAKSIGSVPVAPGKAVLGMGNDGSHGILQKSVSEVHESLLKAVSEGKVNAQYLSIFGTYKDVERLPQEVRQAIGC